MDSIDTALLEEAVKIIRELNKALDRFELTQLLSGLYDKEGAVISITAGAGGTDAQVYCVHFKNHDINTFFSLYSTILCKKSLIISSAGLGRHAS